MKRIAIYSIFILAFLFAQNLVAQEWKEERMVRLNAQKAIITEQEKEALKFEVEDINERLKNQQITKGEAHALKTSAANKHALNIENRLAIINNKIALLERNEYANIVDSKIKDWPSITISSKGGKMDIKIQGNGKPLKYDIRTSTVLLFATGFNNVIMPSRSLKDSPYKIGRSRFVELGYDLQTRVLKNSNFIRLHYGISFQWDKLVPKNNQYFVQNGNMTNLEQFPLSLKKSKLTITNLVFPLHIEFGPSLKLDRENIRYVTTNHFKIGIGGYAGFNIGTKQKLKYNEDDAKVKEKIKKDYNTTNFVYGLSSYIGFGNISLYAKYNLSPIFKNQTIKENNISLGLRFDLD